MRTRKTEQKVEDAECEAVGIVEIHLSLVSKVQIQACFVSCFQEGMWSWVRGCRRHQGTIDFCHGA